MSVAYFIQVRFLNIEQHTTLLFRSHPDIHKKHFDSEMDNNHLMWVIGFFMWHMSIW